MLHKTGDSAGDILVKHNTTISLSHTIKLYRKAFVIFKTFLVSIMLDFAFQRIVYNLVWDCTLHIFFLATLLSLADFFHLAGFTCWRENDRKRERERKRGRGGGEGGREG